MRLAILGAGGHGKVIADMACLLDYSDVHFFDDAWPKQSTAGRWPVFGTTEKLLAEVVNYHSVIVGIGDNKTRVEKHFLLAACNAPLVTLVHPGALVSNFADIGIGSVICAGAVVNVDAKLGEAVIVNTAATVDHDCRLEDGVHIAPGAHLSGSVSVGECSLIGVGASVKQGTHVGQSAVVGAGAVLIKDVLSHTTVTGNPAAVLNRRRLD